MGKFVGKTAQKKWVGRMREREREWRKTGDTESQLVCWSIKSKNEVAERWWKEEIYPNS